MNLLSVIRLLLAQRRSIYLALVIAAIVSAAGSWFLLDNYYLSTAIFYPVNQAATDRGALFGNQLVSGENGYYGSKHDANRVLTIANSRPVIDYVIAKYDLRAHYDIDSTRKSWRTKLRKEFEENYKAIKTEKDAIEISLLDTDPELAATIVNDIVGKIDELNTLHVNEIKQKQISLISIQLEEYKKRSAVFVDSLSGLGKQYGIKVTVGADGNNVVLGNDYRAVEIFKTLLKQQEGILRELNNLQIIREQIQVTMESNSSSLFVLESAVAADKKTSPLRSLIVLLSVAGTFFLAIFYLLFSVQVQSIREKL